MDQEPLSDIFGQLKEEYEKKIPEKLGNLATQVEIVNGEKTEENIKDLRFMVHKLAGSAGTYGYPQVSVCCKEFEKEILEEDFSHAEEYLKKIKGFFSAKGCLLEKIKSHEAVVAVVGMGYIGLSLLEAFGSKGFPLIGYDVDESKVEMVREGKSGYNFLSLDNVVNKSFISSCDPAILDQADVVIISVPTSLDSRHLPDLSNLKSSFNLVTEHLHSGQLIVLQSTTYPGTTEEEFLPVLETSHLKVGKDFFLSYAPEILDPGNPDVLFADIPKILSGVTEECKEKVETLYREAGCETVLCSSIRVAEAAKILQNTYRLVNISLINEMKIMFDRMGIDVWEVIKAAASKPFGFTPFYPSSGIGGDCTAVVPTYLSLKAQESDGPTSLIDLAHKVNISIPYYVVGKIEEGLGMHKKSLNGAKVLVLGVSYKKDVNDLRESAPLKVLSLLEGRGAEVSYHDPLVPVLKAPRHYPELDLQSVEVSGKGFASYDCVFIGTNHSCYDWESIYTHSQLIIDTHNVMDKNSEKVIKA
jgi:UDP-N-acetyl-D-glucosamine dehydrogenase